MNTYVIELSCSVKTKRAEYYGDYGITEKGIGTVLPMVMAVSAGRVRAQFRDTGRKVSRGNRTGQNKNPREGRPD
jgi:hypothetical protein